MTRFLTLAIIAAVAAQAGEMDDIWRELYTKAQHAANSNDLPAAEQSYLAAIRQAERFGNGDIRVATTSNGLGEVYRAEKKYTEAAAAFARAAEIFDDLNPNDPRNLDSASVNYNIAMLLIAQTRYEDALLVIKKILPAYDEKLTPNNVQMASVLCMQGDSLRLLRKYMDAEAPLKRCAEIREIDGGMKNASLGEALNSLALVYRKTGRYEKADQTFTLAETIREKALGIMSPALAETLEAHAELLNALGRGKEAAAREKMAAAIRRRSPAPARAN